MDHTTSAFPINDFTAVKEKALNWVQQYSTFCTLDNHQYQIKPHSQECLIAAGIKNSISGNDVDALERLQQAIDKSTWLFGHLGYELNIGNRPVSSSFPDHIGFPDLYFFEPEIILRFDEREMTIQAANPAKVFDEIMSMPVIRAGQNSNKVSIQSRITKEEYIDIIEKLRKHILRGDCYEINFCQEFFIEELLLDPVQVYNQLSEISPNPFSALYRINDRWLICASPERFLKKEGNRIISQPIKGTSKRIEGNAETDLRSKEQLHLSQKDRSENVMVVDLVRNDLARICKEGTVKVDELYGVYSFPQVHQMISTVSGELSPGCSFADIIRATFPMGSMTGAPKKKVMELIVTYEKSKRGIFSGALGYISPEGDFDFNVVIRSILYNVATGYVSFLAGSGITFYSNAQDEWTECMLKAEAIRNVLTSPKRGTV